MAVKFAKQNLTLLATSHELPNKTISNAALFEMLERDCGAFVHRKAKIIANKMGIVSRHWVRDLNARVCQPAPTAIELLERTLSKALNLVELNVTQLDYIVSHTCTPHTQVPPNAAWLADNMCYSGPYLELRQACTGFANGLQIASAFAHAGDEVIAIVASETGSVYCDMSPSFLDSEQLVNLVQMGDGAAATLVTKAIGERRLISDIYLGQIGVGKEAGFFLDGGSNNVAMGKMALFHHNTQAVRAQGAELFRLGLEAILARGYHLDDFDYILPHQANGHIDRLLAQELGISQSKIINDAVELGNLGSAAIWVSLSRLINSDKLVKGDKVLVLGAEATKYLYGGFVYQH